MKTICLIVFQVLIPATLAAQDDHIFFDGDFQSKSAVIPDLFVSVDQPSAPSTVTINADYNDVIAPVSKYIFGNNANIFMTQMVDQPVLLDHIRTLSPNILRFPGGNLSSVYFWNADVGQHPADAPSSLVDGNGATIDPGYWYGRNSASWTLSVDNYYNMLEATNNTGIITVNYGYARYSTADDPVAEAAHLAAEWVRYDNGRTKFWEVGNESNGSWQAGYRIKSLDNKDGQPEIISGALYGDHFKVFADSMRKAADELDHTIYIGAQLLAESPAGWWNDTDRFWNDGVMKKAGDQPDFFIIHSYYTPFQANTSASEILTSATTVTRAMIEYVTTFVAAAGRSPKPVALTEWNIFAEGAKQQVSFINGMHAAIVTGELIRNRYALACRWDLANAWGDGNDHGMFSQGDQPGVPKWHPRPAFYYLYFFQKYFGDSMIRATVTGSQDVLAYASKFSSGQAGLVVINKGTTAQTVNIALDNFGYGERFYFHSLTGGTDNGPFSLKVAVNGEGPSSSAGGPDQVTTVRPRSTTITGGVKFTSPARSVQYILIENGGNIVTQTEQEDEEDPPIRVYPNPAQQKLIVDLTTPGFSRMEIFNVHGRKLLEQKIDAMEVSFNVDISLAPGVYNLLLHKGGRIYQKKIIIY